MEVLEAIKTRRSIRKYKSTPVDDKILEQVLEAARWSPSWANTQCWRFIVVRDNNIKSQIAGAIGSVNPALDAVKNAPVVIIACAQTKKSGFSRITGEPATVRGDWCMFDVGLAMASLTLAAHASGLGTVHIGSFDHKKVEEILGVPEGFCVVEMTPLGYPDGEPRATSRKELADIVFKDKFGAK